MVCDHPDKFAIVGKKDLYPNQLSGGQQQLVGRGPRSDFESQGDLADERRQPAHQSGKEIMQLFRKLTRAATTIIQVTQSEANSGLRQPDHPAARRLDRRRIAPASVRRRGQPLARPAPRHLHSEALSFCRR